LPRSRLLIVSNRAPVTVRVEDGQVQVDRSSGGLATGLAGPHEQSGGLWIAWTGAPGDLPPDQAAALEARLEALRIVPVPLSDDEVARYYEGVCNGVIWPLFHYLVDRVPLDITDDDIYERINERFAEAVAAHYRPGDLVWVHDYQLMRVPALLRRRIPDARIGFFLHIPFPSSELVRILPGRERLLEGLLGADLIGFHTAAYMRHFASSVLRVLGIGTELDRLTWAHRPVRLGVFPMGIDAASFATLAGEPPVIEEAETLRGGGNLRLLVGIDRLDYTKGIPRRLLAFEALLRAHPDLRERIRLIQVAVPSRENVEAYQEFRNQVDALIGRIHGAFATPQWAPIHYLVRGLSEREVVALYRAADVMLVTPIRDGMNLVAKEFLASRSDGEGVLVLSEFAGAAQELAEALHVNPYDIGATAETYYRALAMPPGERRARMRALRRRVAAYDVHRWVDTFLGALEAATTAPPAASSGPSPATTIEALLRRLRAAAHLVLLLDYDGTLVPFARTPELAVPDDDLRGLLRALAVRPHTAVHVVSGRPRETLESWLGDLPIGLHAEHGLWSREAGAPDWTAPPFPPATWRPAVLAILQDFAARTPGSLVEEKTASLAWHYRAADAEYGASQANELRVHLMQLLSNEPVELLAGDHVIEVRPHGLQKGRIALEVSASAPARAVFVGMGDDRTDEDLFAALPPDGVAIHVGSRPSQAAIWLSDTAAVRRFLRALATPS
jgi:trehalose 6-phosphate synthase/phosphatase